MNRVLRSSVPRLLSSSNLHRRHFYVESQKYRNVWISGLIDPNKTTLSGREWLYKGKHWYPPSVTRKVREIEEARNQVISSFVIKKNIQSAITFLYDWTTEEEERYELTVMDTSDSLVNFTVDVETALRAFDCAILVLSCVRGVQTNSIKIDQQMTRFNLPRLIFLNILDQEGANPSILVDQVKSKLHHHCAAIQVIIHFEDDSWLVDLVKLKSYHYYRYYPDAEIHDEEAYVNKYMKTGALEKRRQLIEIVSEVDDKLAEAFQSGNDDISASDLDDAIRRATIARKFVPIFMGGTDTEQIVGIKQLLDGVVRYLPSPIDVSNYALDLTKNGEKVGLCASIDEPFVALAFTMEHKRLCGKLTYLRVYQGVTGLGDFITNVNTGKKIQVPLFFQRLSTAIYDIYGAEVGRIVAVLDVDCAPGDTFTDGSVRYAMTSVRQ